MMALVGSVFVAMTKEIKIKWTLPTLGLDFTLDIDSTKEGEW